jgi:hypothetical protein
MDYQEEQAVIFEPANSFIQRRLEEAIDWLQQLLSKLRN